MIYVNEPTDSVDYQRCAGRFDGILLPEHPDDDVSEKLDDIAPPPEPAYDLDDCETSYERIIHWSGRFYKKRYVSRLQHGCYYYCNEC